MKQTIRLQPDNYSKILREEVVPSGDLKGYVEVDVKNVKTGEIEHQENHNLIVYGGREWLLKRIFGSTISGNSYASNSCIKWVGFGCGGGEPGNPLQCGTTLGSDNDLRQPVKVQMNTDNTTPQQSANYATRIFPDGSKVGGYYKRINSITLKEDHANPYVKNGITQYPNLIAELRIELGSDECNGYNYIPGDSNLTAYQDINEIALFASEDVSDPGGTFNPDTVVYTPVSQWNAAGQYFQLQFFNNNTLPAQNSEFLYTFQYKNAAIEPWKTITRSENVSDFSGTITVIKTSSNQNNVFVIDDITPLTMFRLVRSNKLLKSITITKIETFDTSYDVKCFCSSSDVKTIHIGDFVFTDNSYSYNSENYIPEDAPLKILDVHDGDNDENDPSYFIIERMGTVNQSTDPEGVMHIKSYEPVKEQPYTMFSRVCLSTIRKTIDREIVIIYKLYV